MSRSTRTRSDIHGTSTSERLLYSIDEAGSRIGLGRSTVYELIRSGELATVKVGRRRLVPAAALTRFVNNLSADRNAVPTPATNQRQPGPYSTEAR